MDTQKLEELRNYYDNTNTADTMAGGTWETDVQEDPMVTTSLRLPKSVLDWLRGEAERQHVKPTALMRQWIEERRDDSNDVQARLDNLERAVFENQQAQAAQRVRRAKSMRNQITPANPRQRRKPASVPTSRSASGSPSGEDFSSRTR